MTLYGYDLGSVREPEDKNLDLQGTVHLQKHDAQVRPLPGATGQPGVQKVQRLSD